jgi:hypothetical protein
MSINLNAFIPGTESFVDGLNSKLNSEKPIELLQAELDAASSEVKFAQMECAVGMSKQDEISRMISALKGGVNDTFLTLYPQEQLKAVFGIESLAGNEAFEKVTAAAKEAGAWVREKIQALIAKIKEWAGKFMTFIRARGNNAKSLLNKVRSGAVSAKNFTKEKSEKILEKIKGLFVKANKIKEFEVHSSEVEGSEAFKETDAESTKFAISTLSQLNDLIKVLTDEITLLNGSAKTLKELLTKDGSDDELKRQYGIVVKQLTATQNLFNEANSLFGEINDCF